jgi:hypothetical protein
MRSLGILVLGLVLTGAASADTPVNPRTAPPPRRPELKKLHVLMVFDTNDKLLSNSLAIDERRLKLFLKTNIPQDRYSLTIIKGDDVTPDAILNHYRDLKLASGEGLLFFYGGHGATDPETKQHYFKLACGKNLPRTTVRKAMEARQSSSVILLSDCCSTFRPINKIQSKTTGKGLIDETPAAKELSPAVRCLLFQSTGTVDVTAATDNASWSDNEKGGLFTRSICGLLKRPIKQLDVDRDGFLTWKEFFPQLQNETQYLFRSWSKEWTARGETIEGEPQKPRSFLLGERTYAVVGIRNGRDEAVGYRWRWQGEESWNEERLEPGKEKVHFRPLPSDEETLPVLQVKLATGGGGELKPRKWRGVGEPSAKNASIQLIKPKKQ